MTLIQLLAADQNLSVITRPKLASGDKKSVTLQVNFSSEWDGFTNSAVFFTDSDPTVYEIILRDDKCDVPHEVLSNEGVLFIGVRGVGVDAEVKTSTLVKFKILLGSPPGTGTTVDPTPDVYQQLLILYEDIKDASVPKEAIEAAVSAYMEENPIDVDIDAKDIENAVNQYMAENPVKPFETDKTLTLKDGVLSVNTTDQMEKDNTLPITSAGVYATVGNIEALLKTI